jgi:hypothetical protein
MGRAHRSVLLFAKRIASMKKLLLLVLAGLLIGSSAYAEVITNGFSIDSARKAMRAAGYSQTELDMVATNPDESLQFWGVGEGVLIFGYSETAKAITSLELYLTDERPKAFRKTFYFHVTSFDLRTGLMTIRATKGKQADSPNAAPPHR